MKRIFIILIALSIFIVQGCRNTHQDNDLKFALITDMAGEKNAKYISIIEAFEEIQDYYDFKYKVFYPKDNDDCLAIIDSFIHFRL